MSQVTEQSVRFQTALASIKLIQASAVLDLTEDDFDFLTSNKVWIATDRSRARRCVEACVYGTLDFVGYPRFPAPVEFIAAVIAYYVHPVNIQTACLIMEGAEFTENIINGVERPVKAAELFAFTLRSEERFSRNAETDLVCRLLREKKKRRASLFRQIFAAQEKHAVAPCACLRPDERKARKRPFEPTAIVPDLHDEQSPGAQKVPCSQQNPAHEFQAVPSSGEGKPRFPPVFGRKAPHCRGSDVGRIGDDEVVSRRFEPCEQISPRKSDAPAEAVDSQVPPRDGERRLRNIDRVHGGIRKGQGEQYGQATRAGAQVERRAQFPPACEPG